MRTFWDIYWRPADWFSSAEREALRTSFRNREPVRGSGPYRKVAKLITVLDEQGHEIEWFEIEVFRASHLNG